MTFVKHDSGKPRLDLIPPRAAEIIGGVLAYGAKKYSASNWMQGADWSRYSGAALRHLFAFIKGEDNDPESGLPHLAHAACCVLFLLEYQAAGLGTDDRCKLARSPSPMGQDPETESQAEGTKEPT